MNLRTPTTAPMRAVLAGAITVFLAAGAAACGGDTNSLSELAQRGKTTATSNGCASCHGANGQGGVGPSWIDLAGSEVVLKTDSGTTTTVIADDAYLLRSILEPSAEEVAGFTLKMPANGLSEAQANDIIAYIKELTSEPQT